MSARDANPPEGARNTGSTQTLTAELLIPAKQESSSTLDVGDLPSFDRNPLTRTLRCLTCSEPPNVYVSA